MQDLMTSLNDATGWEGSVANNDLTNTLQQLNSGATGSWEEPPPEYEGVQTPLTSVSTEAQVALENAALHEALKGLAGNIAPPANSIKKDPLAADKNGWNKTKTGQVDTEGAVQRINANASGAGVTATKDAKGQITLTNLDDAGNPRRQTYSGPIGMVGALGQLRKATTVADAQVHLDSIRQTAAAEQANLNKKALDFAANKLGIPGMTATLQEAEMNDRSLPGWYPGAGDSPQTAKIRQTLLTLQGQAATQAEQYLATNLSSGAIKANLTAAQEAYAAVKQREDRSATRIEAKEIREDARREEQVQKAQDILGSMDAREIAILKELNPSLQNDNPVALARAASELGKPSGAGRYAAIKAAAQPGGDDLVILAAENNADAKTLLFKSEKAKNPFADENVVKEKIRRVQQFALDPNFAKKSAQAKFDNPNSPEAKEYLASMRVKASTTDPKEKAMAYRERMAIALDLERKQATGNFLADTTKWGATDPAFLQAVTQTMQARGTATFDDVMTTYIGSATGMEAQKKLTALNAIVSERTAAQAASVFGKPEIAVLQRIITDKARSVGIGSAITNMMNSMEKYTPSFGTMLGGPFIPRMINSLRETTNVQTDPVTGKPLK